MSEEAAETEVTEAAAAAETDGTSILDMADPAGDGKQEEGAWQPPEGLSLPSHLRGKDANETLTKLYAAYSGARKAISQGKKSALEGDVPQELDAYVPTFEAEGDDDRVAAELNSEASKPIVDAFRKQAHALGIPDKTFAALMRGGLSAAVEAGVPIGFSQAEAEAASGEAEFAKLVEMSGGQREASTIVNTVTRYGEKMVSRGLMTEAEAREFRVMVGTAESAALFHKILVGELGEKPIPMAEGVDPAVSATEAHAAYERAMSMKDGAEKTSAMASAQRMMQKAYGSNPTGSIRSSVL